MKVVNNISNRGAALWPKRTSLILSMIASLLTSSAALADDISVYGTSPKTPQILLTLDYSLSMRQRVGDSTRINILRDTVLRLMDEYKDTVHFGIGPMFGGTGGGVQWPISDLSLDANLIDPSIPPGTAKAIDVVTSLINETELKWGTATIPAFAESVQYFRGGPVNFGGVDEPHTLGFKPLKWNTALNSFEEFNGFSGSSAAYTPSNAYSVGTAPGSKGYCRRLTHPNKGQRIAPNDCTYLPSGYTVSNCIAAPARSVGFDHYINRDGRYDFEVCEYNHSDQWAGANYKSPITNECQSNAIIVLSDGEPINTVPDYMLEDILGTTVSSCENLGDSIFGFPNQVAGNCGIEIADHIANNNQIAGNDSSKITTHTIGFGIGEKGEKFLDGIAKAGNGLFRTADNPEQLFAAFQELVENELPNSQQFSNFSVDIDRASFSHDNRAYVPLFQPSSAKSWAGNIKGYFIGEDGLEDLNGIPAIETVDSLDRFTEESRSFWSPNNDGNSVSAGGASGKLNANTRKLYTFVGNNIPNRGIRLNDNSGDYLLESSNRQLRPDMFGPANLVDTTDLLDWIRNQPMGEPLHSNTLVANYENNERVIYAMTNQGFLHAINASTPVVPGDVSGGEELFAFMPHDLLRNIEFMQNGGFTGEHIYGLDGSITPWHTDENNDGIVNEDDTLILVFGMRRGGNNYYAMDVTNPRDPKLAWQIKGGVDAGFENMAQTWSEPQLITVKSGTDTQRVMVFGGGYDDSVDDINESTPSNGNSIYMVDSKGDLLWSASDPSMAYAIPSDVRVIDSNGDSVADRMYVGDIGGQIWRVDFDNVSNNSVTNSRTFEINLLADFTIDRGGNNDYQPFFYPPSVSRDTEENRLLISIGSGNRDNPIKDRARGSIATIYDDFPDFGPPNTSATVIKHGDLTNATGVEMALADDLSESRGWIINLLPGEKSLSPVTTVNGDLIATTYRPSVDVDYNGCEIPASEARLYAVSVKDAGPPNNVLREEFNTSPASRYVDLNIGGIPPEPYTLIPKDSDTLDVYVGNDKQLELAPTIERVFWYTE